jgi:hypothetical protein
MSEDLQGCIITPLYEGLQPQESFDDGNRNINPKRRMTKNKRSAEQAIRGALRQRRSWTGSTIVALLILGSMFSSHEYCCFPIIISTAFIVSPTSRPQSPPSQVFKHQSAQRHLLMTGKIAPSSMTPAASRHRSAKTSCLTAMQDGDNQEEDKEINDPLDAVKEASTPRSGKRSSNRLGGRSKSSVNNKKKRGLNKFAMLAVSAAVGLFFLSRLFSLIMPSTENNSNFVYYSSSVYETRNYDAATGQVTTSRKENFKSNIPGLVKGQALVDKTEKQQASPSPASPSSSSALTRTVLSQIMTRSMCCDLWTT